MNWDDARVFLAVHRFGTLREAAARLEVDQATVGRRLAALEKALGAKLFLKTSTGFVATPIGEESIAAAEAMEQAASEFERRAQGADDRLEGEVRVTTTDSLAVDFVLPALRRLRVQHPAIRVVLSTSTEVLNLARRDADLAIRTVRPENPDLVCRKLAQWEVGLFASREYLAARGEPERGTAFDGHDLVMYQASITRNQDASICGEPTTKGRVVAEVSSSLMLATSVRAGIGIGELPVYMARTDETLMRVWPDKSRARPYEVWLVLHGDLNRAARVRAAIDAIDESFEPLR
ncbi:LysR family transcriptional regulator [Paraburkholderia bannensis]|uniref:LysR family transcriptional regulator n=1 Tax=Paraburkholderia bannensis TaxID=765414 RepID=UPI002ABD8A74|nr:LysR family transcriptional regulator [Paraburkholderia bannensis]